MENHEATRRGRPALTEQEKEEARARIVRAAADLFKHEGYRAISMRRLASDVGCAPMTLYAYFPAKADILSYIWAQVFEVLFEDLAHVAAARREPARRVHAIAQAYVAYWLNNPDTYRMVFMTDGVTQPEVGAFVADTGAAARYALFTDTLQAALPSARRADLKLRTDALVCGLNGIAHNSITIGGYPWAPAKRLVEVIVNGVMA
jgi:AcrR family transcriptional regulator